MVHQRLGQILAARKDQAARVAPGIRDFHQLEKARDVLVIRGRIVEFLQQLVNHMWLEALDLVAHRPDFLLHAERANVMAGRAQCAHDVEFRFPCVDFLHGVSVFRVRGHAVRMHQH